MEQWQPIEGYEGVYEVSSHGRIRSFWKRKPDHKMYPDMTVCGRIMKPTSNGHDYLGLNLTNAKHVKTRRYVHDIVARTFIGPPPTSKHEVNHADGDKANNHKDNLEWVTRKQNHEHRITSLGHKNDNMKGRKGSRHPKSKLYLITFPDGRKQQIHGLSAFCEQHSLRLSSMLGVVSGKLKQHKGFLCEKN